MNIVAVLVTRGDVDMTPILDSLPDVWDRRVWDNSQEQDLAVFGRYAPLGDLADYDLVYVQDDDCIVSKPEALVEVWERTRRRDALAANMADRFRANYLDSCLVGFGAVFPPGLPEVAFEQFGRHHYHTAGEAPPWGSWLARFSPTFRRTCDVVFTTLIPRIVIDVKYSDREFASDQNRMWKQNHHVPERSAMLELARHARDGTR